MENTSADGPSVVTSSNVNAFEASKPPKIIRILTVFAYLICVSIAAIILSIYYIFLWEPKRHDPSASNTAVHGNGPLHRKH